MAIENRARGFVARVDRVLADLERAEEIWNDSIRSNTDEMRLHALSIPLDNAIRKVEGNFARWKELDPGQVEDLADSAPINVLWAISAHPSGRVREAFVQTATAFDDDQVMPHLANRAIDFVPPIRDLAAPMLKKRLETAAAARSGPGDHALLPTPVHIAARKLLNPRTAIVSPELIQTCIDVAHTTTRSRPGAVNVHNLDRLLDRCRQTRRSTSDPKCEAALDALMSYFNANAIET